MVTKVIKQCPETTCDFYPNNPNNPSKMAIDSAENGRISRVTCSDQRI